MKGDLIRSLFAPNGKLDAQVHWHLWNLSFANTRFGTGPSYWRQTFQVKCERRIWNRLRTGSRDDKNCNDSEEANDNCTCPNKDGSPNAAGAVCSITCSGCD